MAIRFLDEKSVNEAKARKVRFGGAPISSPLTLQEQIQQEQIETEQRERPIKSAILPRLNEAQFGKRGNENVATVLDLLSLPGRAVTSALGREDDKSFLESMAQIEQDDGGFFWNLARDPATGAMVLTLPAGGAAGGMAKALPRLKKLSALTGISIGEGILGAGTTQAEGMNKGEEFDTGQFSTEVGLSAGIPLGLQLSRGLIRGGNKLFGKIAEEATGVPEKALRTYATKQGKTALKRSAGKELDLGLEMLDVLDKFDQYIPEKEMVNESLENMGQMSLGGLRVFVERQKIKPLKGIKLSDSQIAVNRELDNLINRITDFRTETSKKAFIDPTTKLLGFKETRKNLPVSAKVPAKNYKKLRTQIDDDLNYDKLGQRAYGELNNKMFKIRTFMKNNLIDEARRADPNSTQGYEGAMKAWSHKLDIKESLDDVLGGKMVNRKQKAANLMGNIFSKNNKVKFGLVKKLDEITNKNFIDRAGLTELAERLGPDGTPSIMPTQRTGAFAKGVVSGGAVGGPAGAAAGFGISSPALASKTLGLIDQAQNINDLIISPGGFNPASTLGGLITRETVGE